MYIITERESRKKEDQINKGIYRIQWYNKNLRYITNRQYIYIILNTPNHYSNNKSTKKNENYFYKCEKKQKAKKT